jgi:hypothetical protein
MRFILGTLALEMNYGKKVGKFKPKVPTLQRRRLGRIFLKKIQSLKIKSFLKKGKPM